MHGMPSTAFRSIVLLAALAVPLATCDTRATDPATNEPATGESRILLTDAPFPYYRVARVDLFVVSVSASLSSDTSAAVGSGANFVTIATPNRRINVLALQNGLTDQLGAVRLPTGAVTAIRMVIDTDSSSITLKSGAVLTGRSTPGISWQSSVGRPALNALI